MRCWEKEVAFTSGEEGAAAVHKSRPAVVCEHEGGAACEGKGEESGELHVECWDGVE